MSNSTVLLTFPTDGDRIEAGTSRAASYCRCIVPTLLCLQAIMLGWGAYVHAPTYDEMAYLPAGLSHWYFGRFELASVSPPLVRLTAALPLLIVAPETDWTNYSSDPSSRSEHIIGQQFARANGHRTIWYFTLARWACIPFSLLGGYVCFAWARDLYGETAGLVALILWTFDPNVLAHGQLLTPDVATAALGITAAYCFWHWLRKMSWFSAIIAGVALGVAELSKSTLLILVPLWALLWMLTRSPASHSKSVDRRLSGLGQLLVLFSVALYTLNLGYLFEGSCQQLREYSFVSRVLGGDNATTSGSGNRFTSSWVGHLPVPLPKYYLLGIDLQRQHLENADGFRRSYLRGVWSDVGWWYYYLYGLLIKSPIGTLLLLSVALLHRCTSGNWRNRWRDDIRVLAPAIAIVVLVSSQVGFNHHLRYVLPAMPFLFVWVSAVGQSAHTWWVSRATLFAMSWAISSSLFVYPHSLSYFNEMVGGPKGGHAHLIDSNIDWGQDLLYLEEWIQSHPDAEPITLAYFGKLSPELIGLKLGLAPPGPTDPSKTDFPLHSDSSVEGRASLGPRPGWFAISVNHLRGVTRTLEGDYRYFLDFHPVAFAGYSIYIYHVTADEAAVLRRSLQLPPLSPP